MSSSIFKGIVDNVNKTITEQNEWERHTLAEKIIDELKSVSSIINEKEKEIAHLEQNLKHSTAHIINLQTAFNECRDWFSNVVIGEYSDMTSVDYSECSGSEALDLKQFTEELAMNSFERWFTFAKEKYKLETLNDYERFVDENLIPTLLFIGKKEQK